MPPQRQPRARGNRRGRGGQPLPQLVASHHSAARGDVVTVPEDNTLSPASWLLTQNPPRNFMKAIHWIQATFKDTVLTSAIGAVVEKNQSFTFSQVPDYLSYTAVFDQYCIHSACVRIMLQAQAIGTAITVGRLITAIDFDNVGNLASETALEAYASASVVEGVPGKSVERVVKPTVAPALWAGGAFSGYGIARQWVNSSNPGVPHYGVRVMTAAASSALAYDIIVTVVIGLRNNI